MSFSLLQQADFVGRADELESLVLRANAALTGQAASVVVSGPVGIGKTELLKQLFGHLFWKQQRIIPFYYTVNPALLSAAAFSQDYLSRALCQVLAFENKEQTLLSFDGISLDALSALIEERGPAWAREILNRYLRSLAEPLDALRIALSAPRHIALATGMPMAVLIDEFNRLNELSIDGVPEPRLASLFEAPMAFGKTPHVVTGNAAEIHEMPVASCLERLTILPLGSEDASSRALSLLRAGQAAGDGPPPHLLHHLGGNPFYLSCLLKKACAKKHPEPGDYWKAYAAEIAGGALFLRWTSILKNYFPDLSARSTALSVAYKICHADEPLSCQGISKAFALSDVRAEAIAQGLYLAGFIRGEFGVFRAVEDRVVQDLVDYLYGREIQGKSVHDLEKRIIAKSLPQQEGSVRFEMTLPMAKDAELVAAQCLEQIGKNMQMNQDAVGQMQIAVIEACINAIEHSRGADRNIYLTFLIAGDRMEAGIESAGQEFIVQETREPLDDTRVSKAPGRGWGIKLMKRFVDEVRFEKTQRGVKTMLIKKFAKNADMQKEKTTDRE